MEFNDYETNELVDMYNLCDKLYHLLDISEYSKSMEKLKDELNNELNKRNSFKLNTYFKSNGGYCQIIEINPYKILSVRNSIGEYNFSPGPYENYEIITKELFLEQYFRVLNDLEKKRTRYL